MNHPTVDELVLFAYDELPSTEIARVESHLGACASCRAQLTQLATAQAALDVALPRSRPFPTWATIGGLAVAAAAVLAGVLLLRPEPAHGPVPWNPTTTWSATAGYVTGGKALVDIDAQLTRLEQERYYGSR